MGIPGPKRHTQKMGDISESAVVTRLLQCGYIVLTPYGQNHRYDLGYKIMSYKYLHLCLTKTLSYAILTAHS